MSIFAITMVQASILGIGYFINKTNMKFWRLLRGLLVGFVVS